MLMGAKAVQLINDDVEAFEDRVRLAAYALAMEETHRKYGEQVA